MFTIAIARCRSDWGQDELHPPSKNSLHFNRESLDFITYPGSDPLRFGKLVDRDASKGLWGTLDEMKAYFINSGPYELELSTRPSDHLTLSSRG